MNLTENEPREIAETIAHQFGGARAFYMIGAKHRAYGVIEGRAYLQFNIMRNATRANSCRISYDEGRDNYVLELFYVPRQPSLKYYLEHTAAEIFEKSSPRTVRKIEDVYCDTMRETFERETGLTLTMPRVVGFNA